MSSDSAIHAVSGAAGGVIAMIATFPLVSLSTRAAVKERKARESIIDSIRNIIKQEGISGLYDGLGSSLWAISLTNASFYFFFEEVRAIIIRRKNKVKLSTFDSILASFIAGCGTSIVTNPIWVINTNQISQASLLQDSSEADGDDDASNSSSKLTTKLDPKTGQKIVVKKLGFIQTLKKIYKNGGLSAFFRGLGPALVLVINPIIAYTAFEQFKNILIARRLGNARAVRPISNSITAKPAVAPLSDLDNFLLGAFTKLLATGATYPYLVVKSRMQAGSSQSKNYKNAFHGLATIVQQEGVGALYNGISSKLMQSVLTAAFLFASKERIYLATKAAIRTTAKAVEH